MTGWRLGLSAAALSAGLLAIAFGSAPLPLAGAASRTQVSTDPAPQLHVSGNRLVNSHGGRVVLHGVDRSGGEYSCVHGLGIWDGPMDQASLTAMKRWDINAVRVPLNEACWNGQSYVPRKYRGSAYRRAVEAYVRLLDRNGMVAILDLHWTDGRYTGPSSGCSSARAVCLKPMPDATESFRFWTSVARTFKGNGSVIFDLFNEPYPERAAGANESEAWRCWLHGGRCTGIGYRVAGMEALVRVVRSTGARNVIMLGGLEYANNLTQWLSHEPDDPDHNLVASWHSYKKNACNSRSCWVSQIAPVIARVPVIAGEIGEGDCADDYIDPLMHWLDSKSTSYLAWAWNADFNCSSGPSLIRSYSGTPTAYGKGYRAHLRSLS